jgi:hypothetical protein
MANQYLAVLTTWLKEINRERKSLDSDGDTLGHPSFVNNNSLA